MTLRIYIQIVPFGYEEEAYDIAKLDISNTGEIENLGFGHSICSYSVSLYKANGETEQNLLNYPPWTLADEGVVERHDRRDGAVKLLEEACKVVSL